MDLEKHRGPADAEHFRGLRVVAARLGHCVADHSLVPLDLAAPCC